MSRLARVLAITVTLLAPSLVAAQGGAAVQPPSSQQTPDHAGHGQNPPEVSRPSDPVGPRPAAGPSEQALPDFIPPVTDADRRAAFPDVHGHTVHDRAINYFVLFDQLEWLKGNGGAAVNWDNTGWVGQDINRIWFRSEGERSETAVEHAEAQVFYGRAIARWWDVVAGVRQDMRPGPARTWAAFGVQGLAPYLFDVQATAYVGASGRTHFRFETEYQMLLTNRLVLQPLVEVEVYGKADPERGLGAGLGSTDIGVRVGYQFRREFAPYVGITWARKYFGTADFAAANGDRTAGRQVALGLRFWL